MLNRLRIVKKKLFEKNLKSLIYFIATDSKSRAKKFKKKLQKSINELDYMPYKFRQSYYYDNEKIRDLIVDGYTLPYMIDEENQKIIVLDIFKWEER